MSRKYNFKYDELLASDGSTVNWGNETLAKVVKYYRTANQAVPALNFKLLNKEQHFENTLF